MKTFKWTVEFEIDETWVADGFDMDDDTAQEMIQSWLSHAYGWEVKGKVLKSPPAKAIRIAQGYEKAL